jgi:pseudouridylate synthase
MNNYLRINNEVNDALKSGIGVVALESTIIAHGMPYPENMETALRMEKVVRDGGCIPATIAIINGELKVGLSEAEINLLAKSGTSVMKCSRRDLPVALARKLPGATTVAATMIIAEMAGIEIFATGGIGGVHRGAAISMDISADLQEMARTNVTVVSAGAKAILDLGLTLEYLETFGVPVIGYRTLEFPAFYTRHSGHNLDIRADHPAEIAQIIDIKRKTGLAGGILVANPIPESWEIQYENIQAAIGQAIHEAALNSVKGKSITPWLLSRISELTAGESLSSNIALVENNVRLAAEIAVSLAEVKKA